jgi:6-phosphogluconolactonase/glucosamine-6-phosphate isomerase/deaminase
MIEVVKVKDKEEGQVKAHDLLLDLVSKETLLALSGGTSMDYRAILVEPDDVVPGAICVVDERYGEPFHENSNELLMKNAGIKEFADQKCIESHKVLRGEGFLETAKSYEQEIEDLFSRFQKKVGVMGVGDNLHTAGIFPYSVAAKSPNFVEAEEVQDSFPLRITITLRALGEFTNFVVMMFGEGKREAVKVMLSEDENDMQKYPAIFYRKSKIKSFLVTDIVI